LSTCDRYASCRHPHPWIILPGTMQQGRQGTHIRETWQKPIMYTR
jgi:hypothetical protein